MEIFDITEDYVPFGSGLPRSSGAHLTQIIRSLRDTLGLGKTAEGWEMNVSADIGFLWEDAFSIAYKDKVLGGPDGKFITRPGEIIEDGVVMSPDGFGPDWGEDPFGEPVNHEYKFTWRSSKRSPQDDFYWDNQFKAYNKGLGTTVTILHVFYVMGDYRGSGPQNKTYRLVYTQKEIDNAWGMIVQHAVEKGWLNNE